MKVEFHASVSDQATTAIAFALHAPFDQLGGRLEGDDGGIMEHLWIGLELVEHFARADGTPRHPFRFQKRVSGRGRFGLPSVPDWNNVGHFSVRPDFAVLLSLPDKKVVPWVLSRIHESTQVLVDKHKRLGGFDAVRFRERLLAESRALGHDIRA